MAIGPPALSTCYSKHRSYKHQSASKKRHLNHFPSVAESYRVLLSSTHLFSNLTTGLFKSLSRLRTEALSVALRSLLPRLLIATTGVIRFRTLRMRLCQNYLT